MYPEERKVTKEHIVESIKCMVSFVGYLSILSIIGVTLFGGKINYVIKEGLLIKLIQLFI